MAGNSGFQNKAKKQGESSMRQRILSAIVVLSIVLGYTFIPAQTAEETYAASDETFDSLWNVYAKILQKEEYACSEDENVQFALCDLDADGVPELIIAPDGIPCSQDNLYYTYRDGEAVRLEFDPDLAGWWGQELLVSKTRGSFGCYLRDRGVLDDDGEEMVAETYYEFRIEEDMVVQEEWSAHYYENGKVVCWRRNTICNYEEVYKKMADSFDTTVKFHQNIEEIRAQYGLVETQSETGAQNERYRLNSFLSYISESFWSIDAFEQDNFDVRQLMYFTYGWARLYGYSRYIEQETMTVDDGEQIYDKISLDNINAILDRFFGIQITNEQAEAAIFPHVFVDYADGCLYYIAADGEAVTDISIVDSVKKREDGNYAVTFHIYSLDSDIYWEEGFIPNGYYYMSTEEADNSKYLTMTRSGTAVLKDYWYEGEATYQIVSYNTTPYSAENVTKGDIDNNGAIDLKDVQMVLRAYLGMLELNETQKKAADVDESGNVDLKDVQMILRAYLGLITFETQ